MRICGWMKSVSGICNIIVESVEKPSVMKMLHVTEIDNTIPTVPTILINDEAVDQSEAEAHMR